MIGSSLVGAALFFAPKTFFLKPEEGFSVSNLKVCFGILYALYSIFGIVYEVVKIISSCLDISFPPGFHPTVTGWDEYELIIFLISQSSVNSNICALLTTTVALFTWRPTAAILDERPPAQNFTPHHDIASYNKNLQYLKAQDKKKDDFGIMEQNQFYKGCMLICMLPILVPGVVTHTLPMLVIYVYTFCGMMFCITMLSLFVLVPVVTCASKLINATIDTCGSETSENPEFETVIGAEQDMTPANLCGVEKIVLKPDEYGNGIGTIMLKISPLVVMIVAVLVTQTFTSYAILIYGRGITPDLYLSTIFDEWRSRNWNNYYKCLYEGQVITVFDTVLGFF